MDISAELKKRFAEDCCIPIDIFTEPIFGSRIELYDRFYNTIERYNVFVKMIKERYTSYEMESKATVTTYRRGKCKITAQSRSNPDVTRDCEVTISDDADTDRLESIALDANEIYLAVGSSRTLTCTLTPDTISDHIILWKSSNKSIATVNGGLVTAHTKPRSDEGDCEIIAISDRDRTKTAKCIVHVTDPVELSDVSFAYHMTHVEVGGTHQLEVNSVPSNATNPLLDWISSNPSVATVDGSGRVTGLSEGTTMITVRSRSNNELTDVCSVLVDYRVKAAQVVLDLKPKDKEMMVGGLNQVNYHILPDKTTNKKVKWSSSNTTVATVNAETGLIKAEAKGLTTIRATSVSDDLIHAEFILEVVSPKSVRDVQLDTYQKDCNVEQTFELTSKTSVGYGVDPTVNWFVEEGCEMLATVKGEDAEPVLTAVNIHEQDYYNDYESVKERIINAMKSTSAYQAFNNVDVEASWPVNRSTMRLSIYSPDLDGHTMISIAIDKPLFTSLNHYNSAIFQNLSVWENVVSTIGQTDNDHIIYSEQLMEDVMECASRSRIEAYGRYILNKFYNDNVAAKVAALGKDDEGHDLAELICFGVDEIIIDVSRLVNIHNLGSEANPQFTNRLLKLFSDVTREASKYTCPIHHADDSVAKPFPLKTRLFTLYKLKSEYEEEGEDGAKTTVLSSDLKGYMKNIYYEGNQPVEFIDADPCQLPMLMRAMSRQEVQENDRKFLHEGLIAEFTTDRKIYVPPITAIPDTPKEE